VNQIMLPGDEEDKGHFFIKAGMGISLIKDNKKDSPNSTSSGISYALGGGYSVSLNERLKLQIGSTTIGVGSDNLDGLHIVPRGKNAQIIKPKNIFEIYNYSYLSVSYSMGNFGSRKYRNIYKRR